MAKLREAQIGRPPALRGVDPNVYLREGQQLQEGFAAISQVADQATTFFKELETNELSTNASLETSERMTALQEKQIMTAQEARDFGVDGPHLLDADGNDREDVELWEVFPDAVKKINDDIVEKYGSSVPGYQNRQEWINRRRDAGAQLYAEMKAEQSNVAYQQWVGRTTDAMNRAIQLKDFNLAFELASSFRTEDEKTKAAEVVRSGVMSAAINDAWASDSVTEIDETILYVKEAGPQMGLEPTAVTSAINLLTSKKQQLQATSGYSPEAEAALINYRVFYKRAEDGGDPILAFNALQELRSVTMSMGDPEHYGPKFYADELAKVDALMRGQTDVIEIGEYFRSDQVGYTKTELDSQQTSAANQYFTDTMALIAGMEPEMADQALGELVNQAARKNFMPDAFKTIFARINSGAATLAEAQTAIGLYGSYASANPIELGNLAPEATMVTSHLYDIYRHGGDLEEGYKLVRDTWGKFTSEEQKDLEQRYNRNYIEGTKDTNVDYLESGVEKAGSFWGWLPFKDGKLGSIPPAMQFAFDNLALTYFQNTGDIGVSRERAMIDVMNTWAPTKINSTQPVYMRWSPEAQFGVSAEAVSREFNAYTAQLPEGEEYYISEAMTTNQGQTPTYTVMKLNQWGLPEPVWKDGAQVVWRPNGERLQAMQQLVYQERLQEGPVSNTHKIYDPDYMGDRVKGAKEEATLKADRERAAAGQFVEGRSREMGESRRRTQLLRDLESE